MSKVKDFKADVLHEINMLKKHATKKEKVLLDFDRFNYDLKRNCIYGQLTGSCDSKKAEELMDKCCIRVMNLPNGTSSIENRSISDKEFIINGKNKGQGWWGVGNRRYAYLSALEGYICTKGAKNKEIINYIKGNTDKLTL